MKIRSGFVSNSSSSSFLCDVCSYHDGGMDYDLSDVGMMECIKGHTFCESHKVELTDELKKGIVVDFLAAGYSWFEDRQKEIEQKLTEMSHAEVYDFYDGDDVWAEGNYEVPVQFCPICMFTEVKSEHAYKYFLKKHEMSKGDLLNELTDNFKNYKEFKEYIK